MTKRNFNDWLNTFTDSIATWEYYTDFDKVYRNVNNIKIELNILNTLIGSKNIEEEFKSLIEQFPQVLKCIPILMAKREKEVIIKTPEKDYKYNFNKMNYSADEYCLFMRKNGLFELFEEHIIANIYDYVTGVEVGLDSNGRKNRTGHSMEDLVQEYIEKSGYILDKTFFKEMTKTEVENRFSINLGAISNEGKTEKRFDFVIVIDDNIVAVETNFYASNGSKLNETARSYKSLATEAATIDKFKFVWITDGTGWIGARHNLEETFDILEDLYNINDLKNGAFDNI